MRGAFPLGRSRGKVAGGLFPLALASSGLFSHGRSFPSVSSFASTVAMLVVARDLLALFGGLKENFGQALACNEVR